MNLPFLFAARCELPIQNYKEESIDSTIESPDVIPADSQGKGNQFRSSFSSSYISAIWRRWFANKSDLVALNEQPGINNVFIICWNWIYS